MNRECGLAFDVCESVQSPFDTKSNENQCSVQKSLKINVPSTHFLLIYSCKTFRNQH